VKQGEPATTELVLVGGGHAHVQVLKSFGMQPVPGVRLTLVARDVETPYSGMLPGFIAGHYDHDACHIDLMKLAGFARARLIHGEAVGIDRSARMIMLRGRPPIRYDLLSLDIGSTPKAHDVPGAAEYATPVKPVDRLAGRWAALVKRVEATDRPLDLMPPDLVPLDLVVVGGGAAGVELALAVDHRFSGVPRRPRMTLVTRGELLAGHTGRVRAAFQRVLLERGVTVHDHADVVGVEPDAVVCADGRRIRFDEALWAVQAGAAPWLRQTGLELDDRGFVAVDATLRSVNDERVFAVGDVASVLPYPREKAGVFAVRQGPPLTANLRRALAGEALRPFKPQTNFLKLISTGDRYAVASRGRWSAEGRWVWRLKDWIDRRFMEKFQNVPAMAPAMAMAMAMATAAAPEMRCAGCGAKVPAGALRRVLERLKPEGLDASDDAAVLAPPGDGRLMVQTIDFFPAFTSDPYLFGRIAANHALGDIHAMGAEPLTALAIACVPPASPDIVEDDLFQMLRGGLDVLEAAGARLAGGHSAEGSEPALGFTVTGAVAPDRILHKRGLKPGNRLILTKPLGTGALLAAAMRGKAKARWIVAALAMMQRSSGPAARCLTEHGATACTDVTGFGLIGHLAEMAEGSGTDALIDPARIPVLDGALEMLEAGVRSTLHPGNAEIGWNVDGQAPDLLFDPQTAGGLLAGIPAERADACVEALRRLDYAQAAVIGIVEPMAGTGPRIRLGNFPAIPLVTLTQVPAGNDAEIQAL
jgi:selenide,water dikinase